MNVAVRHFPAPLERERAGAIAVIDVLRATSVIVTALAHGAAGVVAAAGVEEARSARVRYPEAFLGGERANKRIDGFDAGNSPAEYGDAHVRGRVVVLTTTNGTQALAAASAVPEARVTAAALFNVNAVVNDLAADDRDALLYCAGSEGRFSLEDALCAGAIAHRLHARGAHLDDEAVAAAELYAAHKHDLAEFIARGEHARRLIEQGFAADVTDVAAIDRYAVVPVLVGEMLKNRLAN
jgi:2-phosphosulfolactate phosphatase